MSQIVLTPEQMSVVAQAKEPIAVLDDKGRELTRIDHLSPADRKAVEQYKRNRALNVPSRPAAQVMAMMRRLEEIRQSEGMDEAKMHDLIRRMRAGEEV